jgi:1-aminocyclopropane-1-carboxylate deaminase/D-cysteine desulfhydrase-like pyridoxal-dependent ACC family enzyme
MGNKVRKFRALSDKLEDGSHIVSYGGFQSNAMLALSRIAHAKKSTLHYFTSTIPSHLKATPIGNYKHSLQLGAKVR